VRAVGLYRRLAVTVSSAGRRFMSEQTRQDGTDGSGGIEEPGSQADTFRDEGEDALDQTSQLRRHTETMRRTGDGLREVHDRLQSNADRVKSLRSVAQRLGDDIARTREAVEERRSQSDG
jgi:hypothetical protein